MLTKTRRLSIHRPSTLHSPSLRRLRRRQALRMVPDQEGCPTAAAISIHRVVEVAAVKVTVGMGRVEITSRRGMDRLEPPGTPYG